MKISAAKGAFYLSISSIFILISGYASNIWLGRNLGPEAYGIYGVVISLTVFVNTLQISGITQAASKFVSEGKSDPNSILKTALLLQTVLTLVLTSIFFVFAEFIASLLGDLSLVPFIKLSSFIFPLYGFYALFSDYYNGLHYFREQAIMNILYSLFKAIAIIVLAYLFHIQGAIIGFIIAPFIALVIGFRVPTTKSNMFPPMRLIKYALPLVGFALLLMTLQSMDLFLIKVLSSKSEDPGFYTANQNIARIPFFALNAFSVVIFPSISMNESMKLHEQSRKLIHSSLRMIMLVLIPITFLISATSGQILELLFSKLYLPAASSLSILIFATAFLTLLFVMSNILNGAGEVKKSFWTVAFGVIITILLCFFMIPKYGLIGAALSTTVGSLVAMTLATCFVYRIFHALVSIMSITKIAFASLIVSLISYFMKLPLILMPFEYLFLFGIYLLLLKFMGEISVNDWSQVKLFLPKGFKDK